MRPLDTTTVADSVRRTGRIVVVDEDYREFGLSGEIAAVVLETVGSAAYARVATDATIPYARRLEDRVLPSVDRIVTAARSLLSPRPRPGARTGAAPVRGRVPPLCADGCRPRARAAPSGARPRRAG